MDDRSESITRSERFDLKLSVLRDRSPSAIKWSYNLNNSILKNEKENKNKFEKEKYVTYADGKSYRRSQSMPTAYLHQRLFSLSRRHPTPTGLRCPSA
jgi:hypothetical protein